ncbi:MAG TPA: class I SAM-dependent rRNA methyltransferase [Gammaproteobacteria bacterium]|nr:class I SAM-dependent rRNA methyltransferase [Gammaproteobacteria bacterium]
MALSVLRIKKHQDRRLRAGHLWVYSNEVDVGATPLTGFEPGQPVRIEDHGGKALGCGYVNPHSLICARLVSRDPELVLDKSLLVHRLNIALSLRERVFAEPCYRLVYGESDALPGLVVDRFGDVLVAQITTAGMERLREEVLTALDQVLKPKAVLWRNDSGIRAMEGLEAYVEDAVGTVPERLELVENGARFEVAPREGQKTGWYYDHRMNRARMQPYVRDKRVLDVFSYVGAWGVQAAVAGAAAVTCVDASARALEGAAHNAELNAVADRMDGVQGDAFDALKALRTDGQKYDVVILDPPAFIKRKKDTKEGLLAYRRINQLALQLLSRDGVLVSASCSYHLSRSSLREVLGQAGRHVDRQLQILEQGHLGPDHPVHPAMAETDYLKSFTVRVLPR